MSKETPAEFMRARRGDYPQHEVAIRVRLQKLCNSLHAAGLIGETGTIKVECKAAYSEKRPDLLIGWDWEFEVVDEAGILGE